MFVGTSTGNVSKNKIIFFYSFEGRVCRVLSSHYQKVTSLVFTQDGAHFLSAGQDGQVSSV